MCASDSYDVLCERIGFPGSERLRRILQAQMSPDVAAMVVSLPGTVGETAEKTGFAADQVRKELDNLWFKGVVFSRGDYAHREYFRFARSIGQLHDASQAYNGIDHVKDRAYFELWQDFVMNEMYPRRGRDAAAAYDARGGVARSRIVPAYKSIEGLSGVLPIEDYRELVKAQKRIAVVRCSCRLRTTAVDEHCEHCAEEERWNCMQFNRSADYNMTREAGLELSPEEAVDLIGKMEDDALIHIWPNSNVMEGINTSCNCCRDCCMTYIPMDMVGESIGKVWEKSRYEAYMASLDACDGCQDCVDRCQFDAISMEKISGAKRMKAAIDAEKCWGCGVCVVGCEPKALKMKVVRPVEWIPVAAAAEE